MVEKFRGWERSNLDEAQSGPCNNFNSLKRSGYYVYRHVWHLTALIVLTLFVHFLQKKVRFYFPTQNQQAGLSKA
jgi:hypothetical protein